MSTSRIRQDLPGASQANYPEANGTGMIRSTAAKVPHVCVIGAGVAGLRCADTLLQHGVKVTVLEGRDRVGGRLCQSNVLGHLVDLGPNWIHGTDNNPMLDLAKQTSTLTMNWDGRQSVFDHLGNHMPDKEALENTEMVWTIIEQAMKLSNEESAAIPAGKSLYDFFQEQVEEIFPSKTKGTSDEGAKRKQQTILQMAEMWGAFVGSPIQKQSLKFFWLEECIDGENLFVADTYDKVLARIAEPALKADIKFGYMVTKIISNDESDEPSVLVDIEGKESETFDEVVMTAPLGWLKRNMDAFEPELPKRLKEGIESIGYGHLDKVYINFPTAFWNESSPSTTTPPSVLQDESLPNVTATTAPLHQDLSPDSSDSPVDPSHYPGFTHWARPDYAPGTNPQQWNQEAVNLAALPASTAHPTLLFYIYGPTSLHIAKLLAEHPSSEHHALLTTFFHPYFSRLPNYNSTDPSHQPKSILATAWANDELAGYGSYSNFQVGLERGDEDIEVMRRGLPERGLWLAGEHTSPFVALATLSLAQDASSPATSQDTPTATTTSSTESTTSELLPFYPPYPISHIDPSAPTSTSEGTTTTATDYFWQHEYRDYYASIITVLSTSTVVYVIDCAPNSKHASYNKNPQFTSAAICASNVVGRGPLTVTQGQEQWNFAVTQTARESNRSTTETQLATVDVTCAQLGEETKRCTFKTEGDDEGEVATVEGFQDYFSTMNEALVTVTAGLEKLPQSMLSSLVDEATEVVSSTATNPSSRNSASVLASSSTAAAPRITRSVGVDLMFGAAGGLGAVVFGL
ncbi:Nn.00g002570.m01.CDS01 [Neocucurbitaria sp. VM-36]